MRISLPSLDLAAAERHVIELALETFGSIVEATKPLGIDRHALKRRIIIHKIQWPRTEPRSPTSAPSSVSATLADFNLVSMERQLVEQALKITGQINEAGALLGITRHSMRRRIRKHGIKFKSVHPAHAERT